MEQVDGVGVSVGVSAGVLVGVLVGVGDLFADDVGVANSIHE